MNDFFTWEMLATYAGAALATGVFAQFLKERWQKLPTQWLTYIIALVVLMLATVITVRPLDVPTIVMVPFNAVLVSLAANGGYSAVTRATKGKEI